MIILANDQNNVLSVYVTNLPLSIIFTVRVKKLPSLLSLYIRLFYFLAQIFSAFSTKMFNLCIRLKSARLWHAVPKSGLKFSVLKCIVKKNNVFCFNVGLMSRVHKYQRL